MTRLIEDNIISMTELQKLSLKKLRKRRLPLFVIDRKSKKGGFVIVDAEQYRKPPVRSQPTSGTIPKKMGIPDYRNMGLLWDRPDLSNEDFDNRLKDEHHYENVWAVTRLLERARSEWVKKILSLEELQRVFPKVRLRPPFQEAWSRAIHYWTETS